MMADMFGTKWTNSHGVKPDERNVWGAALAGLDSHDIKKGLGALSQSGKEWPPSAPEFRKMCIDKTPEEIAHENKRKYLEQRNISRSPVDYHKNKKAAAALKNNFGKDGFDERMESDFEKIFGDDNE